MTKTLTFTAACLFLALPAEAEEPRFDTEADAYCQFAKGVGMSTAALLFSPQLYLNYGYINGDDNVTGAITSQTTRMRVTAGVRYSMSELYQGAMVSKRANLDCARYRSLTKLNAFLETSRELLSEKALQAKVAVLQAALPHATELLNTIKEHTSAGRATIEQLNATELRIDAMKSQLAEAQHDLAIIAHRPHLPAQSIASLMKERDAAESAFERVEGRIRRAQGWDLVLRGGYDRIFYENTPPPQNQVPLFGIVTAAFNPGWFAQWHFDKKALEGRRAWIRMETIGTDARIQTVLQQYGEIEISERARLKEQSVLLADLEARMATVEGVEGARAQSFRDYLWFDIVRLRAEVAYLKAHLEELAIFRGEGS